MTTLIEHAAEIITAAAQSPLGILALCILVIAVLASLFFKEAPVRVKSAVFAILFAAVIVVGVVALGRASEKIRLKSAPSQTQVEVQFKNSSTRNIYVGWINHDGRLEPYTSFYLDPEKSKSELTYVGHVWEISDASTGEKLKTVIIALDTREVDYGQQ